MMYIMYILFDTLFLEFCFSVLDFVVVVFKLSHNP